MKYQCDNCEFETDDEEAFISLHEIDSLADRLDPGGTVPDGECPECGALVYMKPSLRRKKNEVCNYE